jgi:hypothetical protein
MSFVSSWIGRCYYSDIMCGDPGLPIWNTRYAYNSRSHDQCVVNPHIRVYNRITSSFTVPNNILTIGHMTKYDIAMQGKFTIKQRIPRSVDDPRHAYYPTGNWLRDVPSSHRRYHNHLLLLYCLLHSLTKLIARDKTVSTFSIVVANHLRERVINMQFGCSKREVVSGWLLYANHSFSCRYSMSYDISIS